MIDFFPITIFMDCNFLGCVYFVSCKSTAGAILSSAENDWLKWSHGMFRMHDVLI